MDKVITRLLSLVNNTLNRIEHLGSRSHRRGKWYRDGFYHRLMEREVKLACLKPGARVLHIGCGHLPMTALHLAGMGFSVEAIDCDPAAVRSARQMVRRHSQDERITVSEADGRDIDCSP
jgi:protein-L-isoaspartate O-methyltransferase